MNEQQQQELVAYLHRLQEKLLAEPPHDASAERAISHFATLVGVAQAGIDYAIELASK